MAKKGGVQQIQADISTDEDFAKFIERPGLIVMDVYTEWCGPCIGMVGSLKKIKLELGGDNLHLAICKADTIEVLKRFRNKSEPTWLFVSDGKGVNILFGTNVPLLIKTITQELELDAAYRAKKAKRTFYEIDERQPVEQQIYEKIQAAEDKARLAEQQAAEAKRRAYLMFVTDEIKKNMVDLGVTIFGPQIARDMYKKLMEPADAQKLSCKDRRILQVTPQDLEVLHFSCPNPLPPEVWEQMLGKDLLTCLWKAPEGDSRGIDEILAKYVYDCTKPQPMMDEFGNPLHDQFLPPLLPPLKIEIKDEEEQKAEQVVEEEEEAVEDDDLLLIPGMELPIGAPEEEDEGGEEAEMKKVEKQEEAVPKQYVTIPPVWAPGNRRTMAAAIYLFYRWHTGTFLPPDPVPDPPHLAVAFDAYKRKDLKEFFEKFKGDVMAYGYFTTAHPDTAKLIANMTSLYEKKPAQVTDKIVIKVSKQTSHALLHLATFGPCYISSNTVEGEKDCKKFFPPGYITEAAALRIEEEEAKDNKKKKKKSKAEEVEAVPPEGAEKAAEKAADEAAPPSPEEGEGAEGKAQTEGEEGVSEAAPEPHTEGE